MKENFNLTKDIIFKRVFGKKGNEDILKELLELILSIQIKELEVNKDVTTDAERLEGKIGIMDITAKLNNNVMVNIEIQVENEYNIVERSLFYWSGMYYTNLLKGKNYNTSMKTIVIAIMNFDYFKEGKFHEIARIKRDSGNLLLTDKLELHFIQLPKFRKKCKKLSTGLDYWLALILNYEMGEVKKMAKENKNLKKAIDEMEYLTGDEAERRWAYLRLKAEIDENTAYSNGYEQGIEQGIEQGMKQGIKQGKEKGKEEGILEGKDQGAILEKIETAKRMLKAGVDTETIVIATNLEKEEIEKLAEKL